MEKDTERDLISELPHSIIESILTRLPIRDAVRTSILSTNWRYKWASMTHLVFDDRIASQFTDTTTVQDGIVNFVTKFLSLHDGPIHKFSLISSYLQSFDDIDEWLLFVSGKYVKELVIQLGKEEWFIVPSCVYSCKDLTRLELGGCELVLPPNFEGFSSLKYLSLEQVGISRDDTECLISSCPLLESLILWYFDSLELTIRAPNLKYLNLSGVFKDVCLADTPLLVAISVIVCMTGRMAESFGQSSSCLFKKFLGGVPKLERLSGCGFTKYLSIGTVQGRTPIICHHLKFIDLYHVSFDDIKEVFIVLQLIVNSPNLEGLQISASSNKSAEAQAPELRIWDENFSNDCTLDGLKTVDLVDVVGLPHEMKFIKFLLEHSPALEEMSIRCSFYGRQSMLQELLSFRRASPKALIVFDRERM